LIVAAAASSAAAFCDLRRVGVAHGLDPDTWHCHVAEQLCRLEPPVPREDHGILVDDEGIGEAKRLNRVGDLPDLFPNAGVLSLRH
jgi:hypothetical protein